MHVSLLKFADLTRGYPLTVFQMAMHTSRKEGIAVGMDVHNVVYHAVKFSKHQVFVPIWRR